MYELVIFDCDGVLVDSEGEISNDVLAWMLMGEGLADDTPRAPARLPRDVARRQAEAKLGRPLPPDWLAEYERSGWGAGRASASAWRAKWSDLTEIAAVTIQ